MSSKAKNFRRRTGDDEDDDNDSIHTSTTLIPSTATKKPQSKPSTVATAKPKKPPHQAPKNLLSFADDEDSPISRPSIKSASSSSRLAKSLHSSSSHKLTSVKDRVHSSSKHVQSNVQPQAGIYTKEALLELQKNTRTLASSCTTRSEPVIVLKGLVKPMFTADSPKEVTEVEDEDDKVSDSTTIKMNSLVLGKNRDSSGSLIPDQATIDAIRAKRERLRQAGAAAPDFISIDGGSNHGEAEGLSDEEPEFQGRIAMFGNIHESGKKGVFEDIDSRLSPSSMEVLGTKMDYGEVIGGDDDVDDEDEEDKIWEKEQCRKGLGKIMDDGGISVNLPQKVVINQQRNLYPPVQNAFSSSIAGAFGSLSGLDGMSISQQAEVSRKAFLENMTRLKETHGRTVQLLNKTDENLLASLSKVTDLEDSLSAAGEKFIFMQKLRDFVSVICDFLQDKAPFIEELEYQMQKLHKERAESILERRAADNNDEMFELGPAIHAATSVLDRSKNISSSAVEAARAAAHSAAAAARESRNFPVKLDEFGRDKNLQKRMDIERRSEARKRRKARSDSKRMQQSVTNEHQVEGESSTDESDSEATAYKSNREELLRTADQVFSDAADEYSQLSAVKLRFDTWKKDYSASYRDAYMSLSVPNIFSPYVRLELLKWDPLHEDSDFVDMNWHSLLFEYGMMGDDSKMTDDADANLIPELVEKIAIPILHHEISQCWDIFSTRETKFAVSAADLVCKYVTPSSKALGKLVNELCERLAKAVDDIMVPTWNTALVKVVPDAGRVAAYRFGMSVRLMRNICMWSEILSTPVLEKLALDQLLNAKVIPHLRNLMPNVHDAVTRTERIVAAMTGVWAGSNVTANPSPKLQPLVDYLLGIGRMLEKKQVSGEGDLARRLKKLLVDLNEYDHARAVSRTFHLKEAL
jgi:GC-rich sequence DNA-binding factor